MNHLNLVEVQKKLRQGDRANERERGSSLATSLNCTRSGLVPRFELLSSAPVSPYPLFDLRRRQAHRQCFKVNLPSPRFFFLLLVAAVQLACDWSASRPRERAVAQSSLRAHQSAVACTPGPRPRASLQKYLSSAVAFLPTILHLSTTSPPVVQVSIPILLVNPSL